MKLHHFRIYAYLRASTEKQDAERARGSLEQFAKDKELNISVFFTENVSGASLDRPELFRLLEIAQSGDVLLVEQVDRISRLNANDWQALKNTILEKGLKIVSLDLPTSHQFLNADPDSFTVRMLEAFNSMLLDMLAAIARKDYEDRLRRQREGIEAAKAKGKYKGRQFDKKKREKIREMLEKDFGYNDISSMLQCSKNMIAEVKKQMAAETPNKTA